MAMVILSLLTLVTLPKFCFISVKRHQFAARYLALQAECMEEHKIEELAGENGIYPAYAIRINAKGQINQAQTVSFLEQGRWSEMVIELGGGRLAAR